MSTGECGRAKAKIKKDNPITNKPKLKCLKKATQLIFRFLKFRFEEKLIFEKAALWL
jgi:hypothetical protein